MTASASELPSNKSLRKQHLAYRLRSATDFESWKAAAMAMDDFTGRTRWKARTESALYDYNTIRERLEQLQTLSAQGDHRGLIFALDEGVHGNLGGMGRPILYAKARFGTKQLIADYVQAVADALLLIESLPDSEIPQAVRHDLFHRASHCYGRSALMFSSGGSLVYFHFGVAKALVEQGLLPRVLSGSSAGSVVAAVLGTRTDAELADFFTAENIRFGEEWTPNLLERTTGLRRMFGTAAFDSTFDRLVPDLTFREAYERSGRQISISVSPCERHHSPRLLNAITSPHVLIRSAVRASCAIPGLFEPVQLLARNEDGVAVPYLSSRWIDGLFAADLPAKQLARLYGANHFIVSLINPLSLPTFSDQKLKTSRLRPMAQLLRSSAQSVLRSTDVVLGKYLPASGLGLTNKLLHDILAQQYVGDISIAPSQRFFSPFKLLSPYTLQEIDDLMLDGERAAWPRIEMVRVCSQISRTLDNILARAGEAFERQIGAS